MVCGDTQLLRETLLYKSTVRARTVAVTAATSSPGLEGIWQWQWWGQGTEGMHGNSEDVAERVSNEGFALQQL